MIEKFIKKRKIIILSVIILNIISFYCINSLIIGSTLDDTFFLEKEKILNHDLFYRKYQTGISLSKNSTIYFDTLPLKYQNMEFLLVNYSNSTQKMIIKNARGTYQITQDGMYDLFAIIQKKGENELIPITPHIDTGTEYKINKNIRNYLNN